MRSPSASAGSCCAASSFVRVGVLIASKMEARSLVASRPRGFVRPDERDESRLFGDDDGDGVRVFRDADGGAVARAEVFRETRVQRERQKAGGRGDAVARTTTAPSCSGVAGLKIVTSRS